MIHTKVTLFRLVFQRTPLCMTQTNSTKLAIDFILIEVQLPIHRKGVLVYKSLIDHFMEFPSKRSILSKTQ